MSMGCRHFQHFTPIEDSLIVARLKQAGLNIFGKTNRPEIGQMPYTEPELFGPTCNLLALDYTTGGSSGGAAAAVSRSVRDAPCCSTLTSSGKPGIFFRAVAEPCAPLCASAIWRSRSSRGRYRRM